VRIRDRQTAPAHRSVAAGSVLSIACVLVASTASASDTNLVLLPDWTGILPILLLLFIALIFPANQLLFKPIFRVLDEREKRTSGTRERAEKVMRDAEQTLAKYEQAVRDVRADAERDRKAAIATARKENLGVTASARDEAQREAERAGRELAEALEQSREAMRAQAESIAIEAATRVLGRPL